MTAVLFNINILTGGVGGNYEVAEKHSFNDSFSVIIRRLVILKNHA